MKTFKQFLSEQDNWIHTSPEKAGMFKDVTIDELQARKEALEEKHKKNAGNISATDKSKMAQLEFAIRAKSKEGL